MREPQVYFDAELWIERLRYVNEKSGFIAEERALIEERLRKLQQEVTRLAPRDVEGARK